MKKKTLKIALKNIHTIPFPKTFLSDAKKRLGCSSAANFFKDCIFFCKRKSRRTG
jgi:hypothetical protein